MAANRNNGPLLDVQDLNVSIPTSSGELTVARGISYQVWPGETFAIVGESGCGKSLSSLALIGLQPRRAKVSATRCRFDGQELLSLDGKQMTDLRGTKLAMIFQDPMTSLNPVYTIGDQLAEVYTCHGLGTKRDAIDRATFLLERVGIKNATARLGQYPHQLSGGLRQRVVIAMAMMCSPKLIIADEPTTALDVTVQAVILGLLKELQDEFGMALVLITHDLGVVASVSDRVAVMYAGRFMETGATEQVFNSPTHPYTQGLLDCIPRADGRSKGTRLHSIPGMVPSLVGRIDGCAFRNRCSRVVPACATGEIAMRSDTQGHDYRCIHPGDRLLADWRVRAEAQV